MNAEKSKRIIKSALIEDIGKKDITTETVIGDIKVKAVIISKNEGVIAGLDIAKTAFQLTSKNIKFRKLVRDGDKVYKNQILAILDGEAKKILIAERTALNFLSHLSGIATLTSKYSEKIKPYRCKILTPEKLLPFCEKWRNTQ
jgi:nicotinate-nucleotide pyrophosphorylase (carboxylating)